MKLFIQLEIGDWREARYEMPWLHFASSLSSDVMGTDLDNESEAYVADLVIKLIDQSDGVFLFIHARQPDLPLNAARSLIQHCVNHPGRVGQVVLSGNHGESEQLAERLGVKFVKESDERRVKALIEAFAQ